MRPANKIVGDADAYSDGGRPRLVPGPQFIADYTPPSYLVDDIIQRGRLYSLTARTGHGKTAVALNLAFAVSAGEPFADRDTEKGRVLILAGENPDDVKARTIVTSEHLDIEVTDRLQIIEGTFSIAGQMEFLHRHARRLAGFSLIIIDTAAAYFEGEDDNANVAMGDYARLLRRLTELEGQPAVVVPCHPTKNASEDSLLPRGGGAFLNELDGNLTLWSSDQGKTTRLSWLGKYRGPTFEPADFECVTVTSDKVKDTKGRMIPSVVAVPIGEERSRELNRQARSDEDALLEMMRNWPNGSFADWCQKLGWVTDAGKPNKSRVSRAMKTLEGDKLVRRNRKGWRLTERGKTEADRVIGVL